MNDPDLLRQASQGDRQARTKIVEENRGLLYQAAGRFRGRGVPMEDLVQIGAMGLLKAIDRFQPSYGVQFSTYAVPLILGEIRQHLRAEGMVHVSRKQRELASKGRAKEEELKAALGREVTVSEVAKALHITEEDLGMAFCAMREVASLHEEVGEMGMALEEMIPEKSKDLEERMDLWAGLRSLPPRERKLLLMRFLGGQTQREIAGQLGLSQVQVSRLERKALGILREKMAEG